MYMYVVSPDNVTAVYKSNQVSLHAFNNYKNNGHCDVTIVHPIMFFAWDMLPSVLENVWCHLTSLYPITIVFFAWDVLQCSLHHKITPPIQ